jgi:hypothetical protein
MGDGGEFCYNETMLSVNTDPDVGETLWTPTHIKYAGKYAYSASMGVDPVDSPIKPSAATIGTITTTTSKQLTVPWSVPSSNGLPVETGTGAPYGGVATVASANTPNYILRNNTTGAEYDTGATASYTNTGLASATSYNYTVYAGNGAYNLTTSNYTSGTASASKTATTKTDSVRQTRTWPCAWSESYTSSWGKLNTSYLYHGDWGGSANGNQQGLFGFNIGTTIPSNATIHSIKLYLYSAHWYNNAGGDVNLYLLSSAYGSEPAGNPGGSAVASTTLSWSTKTGGKTITLPVDFGNDLRNNGSRVFWLSIYTGTNGYGYFNGNGMSYEPSLTIDYTTYS